MKKALLLLLSIGSLTLSAQNISDNKVNFKYIQLPSHPVDPAFSTYQVILNRSYELANEDSLNVFALHQDAANIDYWAQLASWREQKKVIDRHYLNELAAWEKASYTGGATTKPQRQPYPPQPVMEEVEEPLLHDDLADAYVGSKVNVHGFTVGAGGVVITIDMGPIREMKITKKRSGSGASTKYEYQCTYKLVSTLKVDCPSRGTVYNTMLGNSTKTHKMKSYSSQYEFDLWWLDNKQTFWTELQTKARNSMLGEINTTLNNTIGFPEKTRSTEVYSVKKFKDHSYTDLTEAYTIAKQGYVQIKDDRNRSGAADKLQDAISAWEAVLSESNPSDKNSRINQKVTAMIYYNLAEAYLWTSDFDKAEQYIDKAINGGSMKFKNAAKGLQAFLKERKKRWQANY
jgi:tetratricopeptide (TPR) repeat protein